MSDIFKNFYREFIVLILCAITVNVLSLDNRTRIAIFDTGIKLNDETNPWLCETGNFDSTDTGLQDNHGHGTNIAGLVTKDLDIKKYCLVIIKYFNTDKLISNRPQIVTYFEALTKLSESNPQYINMSISGPTFDQAEYNTIKKLLDKGVKVIVAAGNDGFDFQHIPCTMFPACYNFKSENFYVVGAKDGVFSNFNGPVKFWDFGVNQIGFGIAETGTSQATANFANKVIRGLIDKK